MIYKMSIPHGAWLLANALEGHPYIKLDGAFLTFDAGNESLEDALARIAKSVDDLRKLSVGANSPAVITASTRVSKSIATLKSDVKRDYKTRARVYDDTNTSAESKTVESVDQGESHLNPTGSDSISTASSQMCDDTHATKEVLEDGETRFHTESDSAQQVDGSDDDAEPGLEHRGGGRRRRR